MACGMHIGADKVPVSCCCVDIMHRQDSRDGLSPFKRWCSSCCAGVCTGKRCNSLWQAVAIMAVATYVPLQSQLTCIATEQQVTE